MDRYFARIVRAVVVSTLGFGGGIGLMVLIVTLVSKGDQHAFQYGLHAGLLLGGIFAFMLVGVLLPLDLTAHFFAAKGIYREIWDLEQTREINLEGSAKQVMSRARKALLAVSYVKSVSDNPEKYAIKASIGTSWRSFGEEMVVEIEPIADEKWHLRCVSRSLSSNVLFDYAKNFDNVEAFMRSIESQ